MLNGYCGTRHFPIESCKNHLLRICRKYKNPLNNVTDTEFILINNKTMRCEKYGVQIVTTFTFFSS
jgi:hypothetical protein